MQVEPLNDTLLVEQQQRAAITSAAGLHIPEGQQVELCFGKVVSAGPGVWKDNKFVPTTLKPDDYIVYNKLYSTDIPLKGGVHHFVEESYVLAKVSKSLIQVAEPRLVVPKGTAVQ